MDPINYPPPSPIFFFPHHHHQQLPVHHHHQPCVFHPTTNSTATVQVPTIIFEPGGVHLHHFRSPQLAFTAFFIISSVDPTVDRPTMTSTPSSSTGAIPATTSMIAFSIATISDIRSDDLHIERLCVKALTDLTNYFRLLFLAEGENHG